MNRVQLPMLILFSLLACLPGSLLIGSAEPSPTPVESTPKEVVPIPVADTPEAVPEEAASEQTGATPFPILPLQPTSSAEPIVRLAPGTELDIHFIRMLTKMEGWALAGEHVLRTQDGGQTWAEVTPPQPALTEENIAQDTIGYFLDVDNAWLLFVPQLDYAPEYSEIWRTQDGGTSWQSTQILLTQSGDAYDPDLLFLNTSNGWFLGEVSWVGAGLHYDYLLLHTDDGGITWQGNRTAPGCHYTGMAFANQDLGWMTRECLGPYGPYVIPDVLITQDGGLSWEERDLPPPDEAPGLFQEYEYCATFQPTLFNASTGRLAMECFGYDYQESPGAAFQYTTEDGGQTWQIHPLMNSVRTKFLRVPQNDGHSITLGFLPRGQIIWFDQDAGLHLGQLTYRTKDGGASWEFVHEVIWQGQFSFADLQYGWAVAVDGDEIALVFTTDGAESWELIDARIAP